MLMALLYNVDGCLMATAQACDQQPLGQHYWASVHPLAAGHSLDGETAYVDIQDRALAERLLWMDFVDGREAAQAVDHWLFTQQHLSGREIPAPHAPFGGRADVLGSPVTNTSYPKRSYDAH